MKWISNILGKILIFCLIIIGIELVIILSKAKKITISPAIEITENPIIEAESVKSYLDYFYMKDLSIFKTGSIISEYEGVLKSIDFVKDFKMILYFNETPAWLSLYKESQLYKETKYQLFDPAMKKYVDYTFDKAPFKINDRFYVSLNYDFKNRILFCKMKKID